MTNRTSAKSPTAARAALSRVSRPVDVGTDAAGFQRVPERHQRPSREHVHHAEQLMLDLASMDRLAQEQGHSLTAIIGWAAQAAFGINITPPAAPESDEDPAAIEAD